MNSPTAAELRQSLHTTIRSSQILVKPTSNGYQCGEWIERQVHGLDGKSLGVECFLIDSSPGSGFAGQVYRAFPQSAQLFAGAQPSGSAGGDLPAGQLAPAPPVALKVLRPHSHFKEFFRDALFRLSYQSVFAPRLDEAAVRAGLIWQQLLGIAASSQFQAQAVVARPLGYYWDGEVASFVEVHEWVDGRPTRFETDVQLLERLFARPRTSPGREIDRKKAFMHQLADLCRAMGAMGLARQYEWYTLVSQANVLTRFETPAGASEFVAVDCRPGLAVPFFLPLSPAHARLIIDGLQRGVFTHFDEVDLTRLEAYIARYPQAFASLSGLIRGLQADEGHYRAGRLDIWQNRVRLLRDRTLRRSIRAATLAAWGRRSAITEGGAARLERSPRRFWFCLLLDNLPFIGGSLLRLAANERYRQHLRRCLLEPAYRQATLAAIKAHDLLAWSQDRRIADARLARLATSRRAYWLDKLFLSGLPPVCHRLATDPQARRQLFQAVFSAPFHLFFDPRYRQDWLAGIIAGERQRGILTRQQAADLTAQAHEARMQGYLRDFSLTFALEAGAKLLYLLLAYYGFTTANFWPFLIATLGPVSPSGVVRGAYVFLQLLLDLPGIVKRGDRRLLVTRTLGLLVAPWRHIGNFFALLEMFADYNEMSVLLANYSVARILAWVPVFGGQGKLLEYYAFMLVYNLPLALRRVILSLVKS